MKTAFVFSGQGSHHFHMGRELFERDACFRLAMEHADSLVQERCGESVVAELFPERRGRDIPFDRVLQSHPAIFMVEYALAKSLIASGVRPDIVLGASLGTFAAAAVAGCIEPDSALLAVIEQAIALEEHCEPGCMIAVMGERERYLTPELLALCELGATNFGTHSVISLPRHHLAAVEDRLRGYGMTFQRLPVGLAFHSRWIDAARQPFLASVRGLRLQKGAVPVVCCANGDPLYFLSADHLWSCVRDPIRFAQTIAAMEARDSYRYIDVGPSGTMATFLKYALPPDPTSRIHAVMSPFGSDLDRLRELSGRSQLASTPVTLAPDNRARHEQSTERQGMKAIIFPGQGSQFKGMGRELFPLFPDLVATAFDVLGYSIEDLCLNDPKGLLSQTQYTQPALFFVNAMQYRRQRELNPGADPSFLAGHSLGEYNALLAAGVFSLETGLRLVMKRGELMAAAHAGGMAAVMGIAASDVRTMLDDRGLGQIDIANVNTPTQTVIAGDKGALDKAIEMFAARDLRCVALNVSAAFHSRLMQPARAEFAEFLQRFSFAAPSIAVIANATARPYERDRVAETLARQIAAPVQWVDSVRYLMGKGVVEFQEIGANVLSKMVNEIRTKATPIFEEDSGDAAPALDVPRAPSETSGRKSRFQVEATSLGSEAFRRRYGLKYAYMAGAMYRGVASAALVTRMGRAGLLSFFGSGGLSLGQIEENIARIQRELNAGQPYGMNLLANYEYPAQEMATVDLYLKHRIRDIEAAAFMQMTPALVRFRLLGLRTNSRNEPVCDHRIVAKVSRPEVAKAFMSPPPAAIVEKLLEQRLVTPEQAKLAQRIPVSHDVCVEADSGGHTDGGIAAVMLPPLLRLRDELQRQHRYAEPICMGLAGGIGGPEAAAAAFLLGADFIATGSINQCTVEAGMSPDGKSMLQQIDIQDTDYAPAGDMFEIGAQVQVMKKSVFFPARANKLLSLYQHHGSLEEIPERTRRQLEGTFFRKTFDEIWRETCGYLKSRGMDHEIAKADANPKHKMALVFRWYFAYCTRIAIEGRGEDRVNYQIQTGPALGSFNQWVKGTELEDWTKRHVDDIALKLMDAAAEHLARALPRFLIEREPRSDAREPEPGVALAEA